MQYIEVNTDSNVLVLSEGGFMVATVRQKVKGMGKP